MKFCLVAPGFMDIPPKSWGAVEIIIWDYKHHLELLGHEVHIVNCNNKFETLHKINKLNVDVCHCHYDVYYDVLNDCNATVKLMTSHCGSIRGDLNENDYDRWFKKDILPRLNSGNFYNLCLDNFIYNLYESLGFDKTKLKINKNAARSDLIKFKNIPETNDTICLGQIQKRKRQYLLENLNVFFVGNINSDSPMQKNKRILGEWSKDYLYENLTDNANLILLSESEAAPLVILEGLMAGLGIVVSESCTANLDVDKHFIDVIPEKYIKDVEYIDYIIKKNKFVSLSMRPQIRDYAVKNHSYECIIPEYLSTIDSIISNS